MVISQRSGIIRVKLGYCLTPYQRLRLYNGAPFSRLLRHAGDTEDVFSTLSPGVPTGEVLSGKKITNAVGKVWKVWKLIEYSGS